MNFIGNSDSLFFEWNIVYKELILKPFVNLIKLMINFFLCSYRYVEAQIIFWCSYKWQGIPLCFMVQMYIWISQIHNLDQGYCIHWLFCLAWWSRKVRHRYAISRVVATASTMYKLVILDLFYGEPQVVGHHIWYAVV